MKKLMLLLCVASFAGTTFTADKQKERERHVDKICGIDKAAGGKSDYCRERAERQAREKARETSSKK